MNEHTVTCTKYKCQICIDNLCHFHIQTYYLQNEDNSFADSVFDRMTEILLETPEYLTKLNETLERLYFVDERGADRLWEKLPREVRKKLCTI